MSEIDGEVWGAEGFEGGDRGKYAVTSETNGVIAFGSDGAHSGAFAMQVQFDNTGNVCYLQANDGIDVAELFVRFYVSLKDDSPAALDTNTGYPIFIVWDAITTEFMLLDFLTDGAGAIDRLLALDTAGTGSFVTTAFTPSTTPQYVEVHWLRHATTGGIQGRLDGSAWDNDDLDHDSDTGMVDLGTVHRLGAVIGGPTLFPDATDEWWFDDVKIDTNDWVGAFSIAHLRAHGL